MFMMSQKIHANSERLKIPLPLKKLDIDVWQGQQCSSAAACLRRPRLRGGGSGERQSNCESATMDDPIAC